MDFRLPMWISGVAFILLVFLSLCLTAQIDAGPVVGSVTGNSAKIYVSTAFPATFVLQFSTDSAFLSPMQLTDSTTAASYHSRIVLIRDLQAETRYFYRYYFPSLNVYSSVYSFSTFPVEGKRGYYKVIAGSCNYNQNDGIFSQIAAHKPNIFLHLGDWNWPPAQFGNDYNLYEDKVAASFKSRYLDYNMKNYVQPYTPVDYIYDDDFSFNDGEGWTYPSFSTTLLPNGQIKQELLSVPIDSQIRTGAINGYFKYFPAYDAVDKTHGIYHKFTLGNIDFFMLDCRNSMHPRHEAFVYDSADNRYDFMPDSDHTMLGEEQRNWLIEELTTSTADWKIIGGSVVFNKKYKKLIDFAVLAQFVNRELIRWASSLSYNWAAYPADQQALLQAIEDNGLKNIVILSGDSHSSMMDDGRNAGLPELSASGLSAGDQGYVNYALDSVSTQYGITFPVKDSLWNGGGSGIENNNFNDAFTTLEFFEDDSLKMCVIDEVGQTLSCMTIRHNKSTGLPDITAYRPEYPVKVVFPNPAHDMVQIRFQEDYLPQRKDHALLTDMHGKELGKISLYNSPAPYEFEVGNLAPGHYLIIIRTAIGETIRKISVQHYQH